MRIRHLAFLLLGALLAPPVGTPQAHADEAPDEDRLARLERLVLEQARQIEALRKRLEAVAPAPGVPLEPAPEAAPAPEPAAPAGSPAAGPPPPAPPSSPIPASPPPSVTTAPPPRLERRSDLPHALGFGPDDGGGLRWGGYLTLEYIANSARNSYFDLHRLVLMADAPITDCLDFSTEIEIEHGGIGGGDRDGDVKVEQAKVTWRLHDAFNLNIGAPLVPFGRYNLNHDDPVNDFTKRPLTARFFVPTGYPQPGVGASGAVPLGCGVLAYDALLSTGFDDGFTAAGGARGARQSWRGDNNESKQLWGRAAWSVQSRWVDRFELGLSGTWSRYDDQDRNDLWGYGVDWLVRKGPFEVQGEYLVYDIERDGLDPVTAVRGQDGLWVEAGWHFMPCALQRCRSCVVRDTSHFTLAARYQALDLDDRRTGAHFNDDLEVWSVGLNYRLTERTVVRFDYSWFDAEREPDTEELTFSFSTYF